MGLKEQKESIAMEQIYIEYYQKIKYLVMKKVGDASVVEDLVSEIFLKITQNLDRYDAAKASLSTWIYTVANRYIMDYYRLRKVHEALPEENGAEGVLPAILVDAGELDANLLLEEQLEELSKALELLKQKERDLIILYYYKEMTLKQVAEMMHMSYANAKVLHKKALMKLGDAMR